MPWQQLPKQAQRSKASGSTVWLVCAQVFFVISQAQNIPEHSSMLCLETSRVWRPVSSVVAARCS